MRFSKSKVSLNIYEMKVYEYIQQGYSVDKIAGILQISRHTVKSHISKIVRIYNLKTDKFK